MKSANFSSWSGSSWTATLAHDLAGLGYDAAGNLTALQRYRETATLIENLTYTNAVTSNRLNSVADAIATTSETWDAESGSFTYDANGNLKTAAAPYSVTAVTYDHQNLPISLTRSGTTTTYRYDDAGQRIAKQVGSGNREMYVLDGATTLSVVTVNSSGSVQSRYWNILAGDKVVGRKPNSGDRRHYVLWRGRSRVRLSLLNDGGVLVVGKERLTVGYRVVLEARASPTEIQRAVLDAAASVWAECRSRKWSDSDIAELEVATRALQQAS